MATLTRRLQLLLREDQFDRLQRLAEERNSSVAALVREAVEDTYFRSPLPPRAALERFLSRPPMELGDWQDLKGEIEESLARGVPPA